MNVSHVKTIIGIPEFRFKPNLMDPMLFRVGYSFQKGANQQQNRLYLLFKKKPVQRRADAWV